MKGFFDQYLNPQQQSATATDPAPTYQPENFFMKNLPWIISGAVVLVAAVLFLKRKKG